TCVCTSSPAHDRSTLSLHDALPISSPASGAAVPADRDSGSPAAADDTTHDPTDAATDAATDDIADEAERSVDRLTAGLLRLHAERMQLLSREQRTRDRFTALHPEVAVPEVAARPGDVHDLAGLRDIGDRLARNSPELPETEPEATA